MRSGTMAPDSRAHCSDSRQPVATNSQSQIVRFARFPGQSSHLKIPGSNAQADQNAADRLVIVSKRSCRTLREPNPLSSSCNTIRVRLFFGQIRKILADRGLACLGRKCAQGYPQNLWVILRASRIARVSAYSGFCNESTRFDAWSESRFSLSHPGSRLQPINNRYREKE
jgi:hypothetical protein